MGANALGYDSQFNALTFERDLEIRKKREFSRRLVLEEIKSSNGSSKDSVVIMEKLFELEDKIEMESTESADRYRKLSQDSNENIGNVGSTLRYLPFFSLFM